MAQGGWWQGGWPVADTTPQLRLLLDTVEVIGSPVAPQSAKANAVQVSIVAPLNHRR
jgi:hypothetical protein